MIMYMYKGENIYQNIIAVSNRTICSRPLPEQIARICRLHPKAVILREKDLPEEEYRVLAHEIMDICNANHVPCILHSFLEIAHELHCTSIHLPLHLLQDYQQNQPAILKHFSVIGTSVHSVEDAKKAQVLGATYLTAGHIYATDCKKNLPPRGTDFLRQVCQSVDIPVYAIGGIHPDAQQLSEVLSCGARGGCIMSGMMKL